MQERAVVQDFVDKLQVLWEQQTNERDAKNLSLATFPFTPTERRSLNHATRQGLLEGTLAGITTFAALRGGPRLLKRVIHSSKKTQTTARSFQTPFSKAQTSKGYRELSSKPPSSSTSSSIRWMEAGWLVVDTALSFAVCMTVSTRYAPAGDPVIESLVSMPGLTAMPNRSNSQQPTQPSVVIHQVCPLAVDLYKTLEKQQSGIFLSQKPQTYYLYSLQRFVANCDRRLRVEKTSAWQDRNQEGV